MKTNMKKIGIGVFAIALLALSACDKHTCPTYSKSDAKNTEVKA